MLDHRFRHRFTSCLALVQKKRPDFRIFETYRSSARQIEMLNAKTSKAKPGQSAHNFGLAADYVQFGPDGWHWPDADCECWDDLAEAARLCDLETPIQWDRPHVQVPEWRAIRRQDYHPSRA